MSAKVFMCGLAVIIIAKLTLADPPQCPDPSTAKHLVLKSEIHEAAPSFGRVEKVVKIPSPKAPSCITLTGHSSEGRSGQVSIAGISITDEGVTVKLVSDIQTGIDGEIEVYTQ